MTDSISLAGLFVALTLPWLCGSIWINWLLGRTGRCNIFVVLGQGFFVGTFLVTLIIRLWDVAGLDLNFWGITGAASVFGGVGILLQRLWPIAVAPKRHIESVPAWHFVVATVLLVLIAWRHMALLQELLLRPLYAWDAWMNWAPKAIVWFHHGALVDFVSPTSWLAGSGGGGYTLGNRQATPYPITVPLIQLWGMLGIGTWDHSAIYLPWVMAPLALGLALFGHLRLAGVPFIMAIIGCYLLLSLPYLNVHSVLAGYADIWLASAFLLGVCTLYEIQRCRHWAYFFLWAILTLLCAQLKDPGILLALLLLVFGAREWLRFSLKLELVVVGVLLSLAILLITLGVSLDIPYLGKIVLDSNAIELGKFGHFQLEYHPVGSAFLETFFVMINWNILWYFLVVVVVCTILRGEGMRLFSSEFLIVIMAVGCLASIFVFTGYYTAALNFVTLNRALLYPVPAIIFCIFLCFQKREAIQ
jgi:hypothetical protein